MTGNNIEDAHIIYFDDTQTSIFGNDGGYWGAGNEFGKIWLPMDADRHYYAGYDLATRVDWWFGDGCMMDVCLGGSVSGSNQYVRFKQAQWGSVDADNRYYLQNYTSDEELNMKIYMNKAGKSDGEFNMNTENVQDGTFFDTVLRLESRSTAGVDSVNLTYDASADTLIISDGDVNISDDLTVDGVTNGTGGFATDTGTGWSGTYTVDEGVVTVRNGIIIDVDWD